MTRIEFSKEQEALCSLYTHAPIPVLVTDQDFNILWSNNCSDNTLGEDLPNTLPVESDLATLSKKVQEQPDAVHEYISANNIYDMRITPALQDEQGKPQAYVAYLCERDTMKQRENFITAPRMASASLDRFRYSVDSIFASLLTLASRSRFSEDVHAYEQLRKVNDECFALLRDTQNLKVYSNMLQGDSETDIITVDITDHMKQLCIAIEMLMRNKFGGRISYSFDYNLPKKPVMININRELLDIALMNIISNSFYYSYLPDEHFGLKIDVAQMGDDIRMRIVDNGPGIPAELVERIYKPFFSFAQTDDEIPRLGLGLTVAKSIVEFFGGYMLTTSMDGDGMDITIVLPSGGDSVTPDKLSSPSVSSEYTSSYFSRYSALHVYLCDSFNPPMP